MIHTAALSAVSFTPLAPWLTLPLAYALGCFNTGYHLVRWRTGRDIRDLGSGNAGATNVGRILGPWGFGVTLLGDMLKGALAVLLARWLGLPLAGQALAIFAVVAGHNWPAPLRFRGGKGVAASCGALLFFDPFLTLGLLALCAALLAATRRPTISALAAYALTPALAFCFGYGTPTVALLLILVALIISPHRADLREELFLPDRTPDSPATAPAASSLQIKIATEPEEFEAIHRLNYRTFVEEIPQHAPNPARRLVDRFHADNRYIIALHAGHVVAMLALRTHRPFSLDAKVPNLDQHLPAGRRPVEVRLLAVEPAFRRTAVFASLLGFAARHCLDAGFDLGVISATTRQLKLYRHLGFTPFGPLVGTAAASYQPMLLTLEGFSRTAEKSPALRNVFADRPTLTAARVSPPSSTLPRPVSRPLNLLPGPVLTTPEVDAAFAEPSVSHRSPAFLAQMDRVRHRLRALTSARHVQVLPGSGSLATCVIAAQLSLLGSPGLVLANGEFGERLAAEARRARLRFETHRLPWGTPFDLTTLETLAARLPRGGWLWCVHHETSIGLLNPLTSVQTLAARHGLRLCVDCISSLGALPVDLRDVYLASGTSGKGLGAYPGLALIFHDFEPRPEPDRLPGYLDLGQWAAHASVPHTHSSNLVSALDTALLAVTPARFTRIRENTRWLRSALRAQGWSLVLPDTLACPGLITLALAPTLSATHLGETLERHGFALHYRSPHLVPRHWLQISLLGDPPRTALTSLLATLHSLRPTLSTPLSSPSSSAAELVPA